MNAHHLAIRAIGMLLPASARPRHLEQWTADLRDSAELGIPARQVTLGALRFAMTPRPGGPAVKLHPIGPLAIALRHARAGRQQLVLIVGIVLLPLLVGIGILLVR